MTKYRHPAYFLYLYGIAFVGLLLLAQSIVDVIREGIPIYWIILASLTALTSALAIKIPQIDYRISIEDTFFFTNLILFGPHAGCITAALQGFMGSIRAKSISRRLEFMIFNMGALVLSAYLSGRVLFGILRCGPIYTNPQVGLIAIISAMAAAGLAHYLANSGSVAVVIALDQRTNIFRTWAKNFRWASISYLSGATFAALVAENIKSLPLLLGAMFPIVLITYFAYKTYREKVEEQHRRLQEMNQLYLRTVESLALAVDAKDRKTYGHVRRVHAYALGLARLLGIKDASELQAIETGAILHDIGKLAVDDFILNRPGRLSGPEFEKMKTHTTAGEEILNQVQFPFPVAKIVRSHHERWDGKGYPDGLKGEEIPLGARVLILADTFDALRSSRPYKTARGVQEAVQELRGDMGAMFDPKLLQLFIDNIEQLDEEAAEASKSVPELSFRVQNLKFETGAPAADFASFTSAIALPADKEAELVSLAEFCGSLAGYFSIGDLLMNLECRIRRLMAYSTCIFFIDNGDGSLIAAHTGGMYADKLRNHRVEWGGSISGWAAAYAQPLINSRATLEFQGLHDDVSSLIHAMVVPVRTGGKCLGTISLYGEAPVGFNDDHMKTLQIVANQAAPALAETCRRQSSASGEHLADPVTGLHRAGYLSLVGEELIAACAATSSPFSLIHIDLENLREIIDLHNAFVGDSILRRVGEILRAEIREKDILVRFGQRGFIALLVQARRDQALRRAESLRDRISAIRLFSFPEIVSKIGVASYPEDGTTIFALLDRIRQSQESRQGSHEEAVIQKERKVLEFPALG